MRPPDLTQIEREREPLTLPNGRKVYVRGITRGSLKLEERIATTKDDGERGELMFQLVRAYIPDITEDELDALTIPNMNAIIQYAKDELNQALERLRKNGDAGPAESAPAPAAAPAAPPSRSRPGKRRSTRTTSSTTASPASGA